MLISPIIDLVIGVLILTLVAYANWYRTTRATCIHWMAKRFFGQGTDSEKRAEAIFMTVTSVLVAIGGLMIIPIFLFI